MQKHIPIMRSNGGASWYARLWHFTKNEFWDFNASAMAAAPTLANTFTEVAYNATLDNYRLEIPDDLAGGEIAVLLYTSAGAGNCAAMQIIKWDSSHKSITEMGRDIPIII